MDDLWILGQKKIVTANEWFDLHDVHLDLRLIDQLASTVQAAVIANNKWRRLCQSTDEPDRSDWLKLQHIIGLSAGAFKKGKDEGWNFII